MIFPIKNALLVVRSFELDCRIPSFGGFQAPEPRTKAVPSEKIGTVAPWHNSSTGGTLAHETRDQTYPLGS